MTRYWNWKLSGIALAACFLGAVILVKPIGVSTQFVIADGIIWSWLDDGLIQADPQGKPTSEQAYINKYAGAIEQPLNYSFVFVVCMLLGATLGKFTSPKGQTYTDIPVLVHRYPDQGAARLLMAFGGGILVLFGARLAGGCTSGHMMSGMMQTSLSGYLFAGAAFAAAVPTAILLHGLARTGGRP